VVGLPGLEPGTVRL